MTVTIETQPSAGQQAPQQDGLLLRLFRGFRQQCPSCGQGALFHRFLKPTPACSHCGTAYDEIRADDFPPYVTMAIVGKIIVPLILAAEIYMAPPLWLHMLVWIPLTLGLTLWLLPRVKGTIVSLMWHLKLRGDEGQ